jgi:subtilisin-like proprotein convertase family protein
MGNVPFEAPRRAARRVAGRGRKNLVTSRQSRRAYAIEPLERRVLLSVPPVGPEFMVHPPRAGVDWTATSRRAVATDALGNSVAVWESDVGSPGNPVWQVQGQRFDAAGARSGPVFGVTPPTHSGPFQPDVAMDAAGGFVVAWRTERSGSVPYGVFFQRFAPGASPIGSATPVVFDFFGTGSVTFSDPSVALDADGDFIVALKLDSATRSDPEISVSLFHATGGRKTDIPISSPNGSDELFDPVAAIDADGNFVLVWRRVGVFGAKLEGRRFSAAGAQQGGDFEVTPFSVAGYGAPQAAMEATGDFVVTWDEPVRDGSDLGVYARRFTSAAAPSGADFLVNNTTAGSQSDPRVAMSAGGEFVIVWNGQGQGITGQFFEAGGGRSGGEFPLSTAASPGTPRSASVAMDGDGDFSAAWTAGAAGANDVYARRFARPAGFAPVQGRNVLDLNADGVPSPSEPGMDGRAIYCDANNDGELTRGGLLNVPGRAANVPLPPGETRRLLGPVLSGAAGMTIDDVDVTINLQHPRAGDLVVTLVSPAGRRAELFSFVGGNGANFTNTAFDDAAGVSIAAGAAPFTGTFRTEQQTLSVFNSEVLGEAGYWMLEVQNTGQQTGTAVDWSMNVRFSEPYAVTDPAGNYSLPLPFGFRTVREFTGGGFVQTFPPGGAHFVDVTPQVVSQRFDFADAYSGAASGFVFHDLNANGAADPGEENLPTWRVFYDANANGQLDPTEPSDFNHETFGYSLRGLPLSFVVRLGVIPPLTSGAPWELSAAPAPFLAGSSNPGKNFGAFKRAAISGVSFNDLNSNGVREPSEPALAGTRVFLDQDGDGAYDDGLPVSVAAADVPRSFDSRTTARSRLTLAGVSTLLDLDLTVSISMPASGAITATLTNPDGDTVPLFEAYDASSGDLVAITFDDEADEAFTDASPPFAARYRASGELRTVLAGNPSGVWTLTVSGEGLDRFGGGVLSAWSLGLTSPAEPSTLTGANGGYLFASLIPGRYSVGAVVPAPWVRTAPPGVHTVDLLSGQDRAGLDFGQFDPTAPPPTRVVQVYAGGPQLMPGGNPQFLAAAGIGTLGYPVPGGSGQLRPLPWTRGIDRVSVQFDRDVSTSLDDSDLRLRGVARRSYEVLSFAWDRRTLTATWTVAPVVFNDKLQIELLASRGGVENLDGEWTEPRSLSDAGSTYPSGDGYAGGDFRFGLNVLAGDATGDGAVNVRDLDDVRRRHGRHPGDRAEGRTAYSVFADVTGDAAIDALDLLAVRKQLTQELPNGGIRASTAAQAALTAHPSATRELFAPRRTVFN